VDWLNKQVMRKRDSSQLKTLHFSEVPTHRFARDTKPDQTLLEKFCIENTKSIITKIGIITRLNSE